MQQMFLPSSVFEALLRCFPKDKEEAFDEQIFKKLMG